MLVKLIDVHTSALDEGEPSELFKECDMVRRIAGELRANYRDDRSVPSPGQNRQAATPPRSQMSQ
jgi:hypothetical protein